MEKYWWFGAEYSEPMDFSGCVWYQDTEYTEYRVYTVNSFLVMHIAGDVNE